MICMFIMLYNNQAEIKKQFIYINVVNFKFQF